MRGVQLDSQMSRALRPPGQFVVEHYFRHGLPAPRAKGPKRFNMQCQQCSALKDICLLMTTTVENEEIETQRGKVTWSISNLKLETKGNGETLMRVWAADK